MDTFSRCKATLLRAKEKIWRLVFFIKLLEIVAMAACLGLALDSIANNAIASWTAIEFVFLSNVLYIVLNSVSVAYHASGKPVPSILLVASPIVGVAIFTFTGSYIFEFWKGLSAILAHEATPAVCVTRGIHQVKLMSVLSNALATVFGIDSILSMLSKPSVPSAKPEGQLVPYRPPPYVHKTAPRFKRLTL